MANDGPHDTPFPSIELDEIDSTNQEVLRRAAAGERGPLWILAHRQTAGRGRSGHTWLSPRGNLAATLLLLPGCAPTELHQLSLLTGIAVHDAIRPFQAQAKVPIAAPVRLKWPNDILAGNAKLGGILIESSTSHGQVVAAIGIGVNIAFAPEIEGRLTAAIDDWGVQPSPPMLLAAIDGHMRRWLHIWERGTGFGRVRAAWLERAGPIGEPIAVDTGSGTISGNFAGIDETGALLMSSVRATPGEVRRFTFGDVSIEPLQAEGPR
jgi:BirA family transcriptional regulator, biotin operon repressor / biotin---[acetyl-CoA-carboxylase] ligase